MKRDFSPIMITLFSINISYNQKSKILNSENIQQLNGLIDSIEQNAQNLKISEFYSLSQATLHDFEISTRCFKNF